MTQFNELAQSTVKGILDGLFREGTGIYVVSGGRFDAAKYGGVSRYNFYDDSIGFIDPSGVCLSAPYSEALVDQLDEKGYKLDDRVPVFIRNRKDKGETALAFANRELVLSLYS